MSDIEDRSVARVMAPTEVDPEFAAMLAGLPDTTIDGVATLAGMRELLDTFPPPDLPAGVAADDHALPEGPVVRVIRPVAARAPRPCLVWAHGGGYMIGNRFMDDARLASWALRFGCVVASVEYRLAPEHPYPAGLDDCWSGLLWVRDNAEALGVDPAAIGVGGLSAGGGLAAALALRARDRGGPALAFQFLDAPMLDDRQATPSSQADDLMLWSRESNRFGWRCYLGDAAATDAVEPQAAPARTTDLAGLPPALVIVGGADGFRDEDIEYALRLGHAGVPTELHVYPGAPHGFVVFPSALASQAAADIDRWLAARLAVAGDGGDGDGAGGAGGPERGDHGDGQGRPVDLGARGHLLHEFGMREVDDPEYGPALEMAVAPQVANPHGGLHGGLMTVLIECGAAGLAVRAAGSENIVAGDLTVRFLTPLRQGPARVVGRVLRAGRRTIVVDVQVIDVGDGRTACASASVAYARLDDAPAGR